MTGQRNILQVGTHSTLRPIHGGQQRSHHIGRVLENAGYFVRGIAACWRQDHDIVNDREAILDLRTARSVPGGGIGGVFGDFYHCVAIEKDPHLRAEFFRLAQSARPDAVLLEHPWMWPLARLIPEVEGGLAPVIYNSQNVEAHLKRRLLRDMNLDAKTLAEAEPLLSMVDAFEQGVVVRADAVTACTVEDAQIFDSWGSRRTIIAGNGSSRRPTTALSQPYPTVLPPNCRYAFTVGSEHQPNVTGFDNLVLPWLAMLRPGQRVVVAGGVSIALRNRLAERGLSAALEGRLVLLGRVNELALSALIENAACIMLPIEYGGGSNIKTAEALLSDRPIVASPASMRGFDEFHNLPGVTIADGPAQFGAAVQFALAAGSPPLRSPTSVVALTWDAMLAPLVALVGALIEGNQAMSNADVGGRLPAQSGEGHGDGRLSEYSSGHRHKGD
jgi:hypothetical protein